MRARIPVLPALAAVASLLFLAGCAAGNLALDLARASKADAAVTVQVEGSRAALVFISPGTVLIRHGDTVDWLTWDTQIESLTVVDKVGAAQEALVFVPLNSGGPAYRCFLDYSNATPLIVESAVRTSL